MTPTVSNPACRRCPLGSTARSVCVGGRRLVEGPGRPDIVFVGMNPGAEEDAAGQCFVGPSGQLLRDLIKEVGIPGRRVWLTNAVRCASGLHNPGIVNVRQCADYLWDELARIKPSIVVPLGDLALQAVTGQKGITRWAGLDMRSVNLDLRVYPIFHPSYVLHQEGKLPDVLALFHGLRRRLENRGDPRDATEVKVILDYDVAVTLLHTRFRGLTAFDYETTSRWPWLGRIRCVGMTDTIGHAWVFPVDEPIVGLGPRFKAMFGHWLASGSPKLAHRASFEAVWSRGVFGVWPRTIVHDTYRMHALLDENARHGLKGLVAQYVPELAGYDSGVAQYVASAPSVGEGYATCPLVEPPGLAHYCGQDADATLRLLGPLTERLRTHPKMAALYSNVVMPAAAVLAHMTYRGLRFDATRAARAIEDLHAAEAKVRAGFNCLPNIKLLMERLKIEDVNIKSAKQLVELIYKILHMPVHPRLRTKGGRPSVSRKALEQMPTAPEIEAVLELITLRTARIDIDKFVKQQTPQGYVHGDYDNSKIVTGRTSCKEPNLLGISKRQEVAVCFPTRFPNGKIVRADYSQLEIRIAAWLSGEPAWMRGFAAPGFDPHMDSARSVFGIAAPTDAQRQVGKVINFSIIYGMQAPALAVKLKVSLEEATRYLDTFWARRPTLRDWFEERRTFLQATGYSVNRAGRRRHFPEVRDFAEGDPKLWRALRQGPNFEIQGMAADLINLAMVEVDRRLKAARILAVLVNQIHDALHVDSDVAAAPAVRTIMTEVMTHQVPDYYGIAIPLEIDFKVGEDLATDDEKGNSL